MKVVLADLDKKPFIKKIEGSRFTLVRAKTDHTEGLWRSILRDRKLRGSSWRWVENIEQLQKYLNDVSSEIPHKEVIYLFQDDTEAIFGSIHIQNLNYSDHKVELGYAIEKSYEGLGYISDAIPLVEAEIRRLKFNKIEIECDPKNARSLSVAERNGYLHEGTRLQDNIWDGQFRDKALFGKILSATQP